MSKVVKGIIYTVGILIFVWFIASWADIVADNSKPNPQHHPYNMFVLMTKDYEQKHEQVAETNTEVFDTSVLESWCGEPNGTIRMVGGWYCSDGYVEDETGNYWYIHQEDRLKEDGFLLLWIADNNTPDDVTDDEIVKVWVEAA